jgi:hypothetical protein
VFRRDFGTVEIVAGGSRAGAPYWGGDGRAADFARLRHRPLGRRLSRGGVGSPRRAPVCALSREKIDLSEGAARADFLARAAAGSTRALVITEGLLGYLDEAVALALGRDLAAQAGLRWWILDLFSPGALRLLKRTRGHAAAPLFKFAPAGGVGVFERMGWQARDIQSIARAAVRFRRAPLRLYPLVLFPEPDPRDLGNAVWFGAVRFERG